MSVVLRNLAGKERELKVIPIGNMISLPSYKEGGMIGDSVRFKAVEHRPFVWKGEVDENGLKVFEEVTLKHLRTKACGRSC